MRVPSAACVPQLPDGRVLVGTRTGAARSFAGFCAFPGGTCDDDDDQLRLFTADVVAQTCGPPVVERIERACALRELGEETGRWLVVDAAGDIPGEAVVATFTKRIEGGESLVAILQDLSLFLDDRALCALGRWPTPRTLPKAFSVRQFLLPLEADTSIITRHNDELEDVRWVTTTELLAGWRSGETLLLPPIRHVVRALENGKTREDQLRLLHAVPHEDTPPPRLLCAGVAVEPLRSPTLPPATHTNCSLLGDRRFLIVDPATPYDDEQARFDALLDRLEAEGSTPEAIVLTHHHHDHMADAARLRRERGIPVWAHAITAKLVHEQHGLPVERTLEDGEVITLDAQAGAKWTVVFTPGHAPGHICLHDVERGVLIAGDMVATIGSILIDPPEGHMGTYLESLQKLIDLDVKRVVPAHGPMLAHGKDRLSAQLAHRRMRSSKVWDALVASGESAPRDLVPAVYGQDTPEVMWALAARSLLAELELLHESGRATRDHDRFTAVV